MAALTSVVLSMNLLLFCLNMLPLPPLDGSAAIILLMKDSTANRYQEFLWGSPMFGMIGMLVAWQVTDEVFWPVFWMLVRLLYPGTSYG